MMKNQPFLRRVGFALNGIRVTFKTEPSFRWQVLFGAGAYGFLILLRASSAWWAAFSIMIGMILAAELFNSAIERTLDRLHPGEDSLIGEAKDCSAAAVFLLSLASLALFVCFLISKI